LDEIGIDSIGQMAKAPATSSREPTTEVTDDEIERQLKALGI